MINILKKSSLTFLSLASILFAGTLVAGAAIDIGDTKSYYALDNWYLIRSNAKPVLSNTDTSVLVSVSSYDALAFCYFDSVSLSIGQTISVSGMINLSGLSNESGANTVISLADSRDWPQSTLDSALELANFEHAYNSGGSNLKGSDVTSCMAGFIFSPTTFYNRNKTTTGSTIVSTTQGGTTIEKNLTFSTPSAGEDYNFEISITKTAENIYSGSCSLNDETVVSFENQENTLISKFDVLAFKIPVASGETATISNLSISVIPEPSLFGLFAGTVALAFAGTRRRRKSAKS